MLISGNLTIDSSEPPVAAAEFQRYSFSDSIYYLKYSTYG